MRAQPNVLSPAARELFLRPNFASLATVSATGRPQVTPVWIDLDDDLILVNTAHGRVKDRNMRHDRRVALTVFDMDNPYAMVAVQGVVVDVTTDGAEDHIDKLAGKYLGSEYPEHGDRVIFKIRPERATGP